MDLGGYADNYENLEDFCKHSFWNYTYIKFPIMYAVLLLVIFPLSIQKDISKLSFSSFLGVFSLILLIMIVAIESPWYIQDYWENIYKEDIPSTHRHITDLSVGFQVPSLYFFRGFATVFYAYCCHYAAFPIFKTLNERTEKRINKVITSVVSFDLVLYLIIGILGYLTNPIHTPDLIIERYKLFTTDVVLGIGRFLFCVTCAVKIPTAYNSFRLSIIEIVFHSNEVTTFR